ncbi:MAG TPA: triose-phosphate isomerase, partial [Patescibacteria group bacterium]|nr:triose-phosphate isomerase [Patescibacteria group bacterium]
EISPTMYKEVGATYALIGHSERRHLFQETNHQVRQKLEAALDAGLTPVLCVGETMKERDEGQTEEVLEAQLRSAFTDVSWPKELPLIVAYEPVWAISKGRGKEDMGKHCEPEEAGRVGGLVKHFVKGLLPGVSETVFLFGGSVRPTTVAGYLREPKIQGVLVGAASTHLESWKEIVQHVI